MFYILLFTISWFQSLSIYFVQGLFHKLSILECSHLQTSSFICFIKFILLRSIIRMLKVVLGLRCLEILIHNIELIHIKKKRLWFSVKVILIHDGLIVISYPTIRQFSVGFIHHQIFIILFMNFSIYLINQRTVYLFIVFWIDFLTNYSMKHFHVRLFIFKRNFSFELDEEHID